jgi:F420-non-reducing hydrogenase iron-sulfur subunit
MKKDAEFTPEITVFSCIYCAYMAADTAGSLRQEYPANIKIIRLPCTGKTDARYILEAFEKGADGVYIVACSLGNCHHERGNERGKARERLDMFFVSGSMGATFANIAHQMTERIRELGPNPLKSSQERSNEMEVLSSK